jgi:hypothetical protein
MYPYRLRPPVYGGGNSSKGSTERGEDKLETPSKKAKGESDFYRYGGPYQRTIQEDLLLNFTLFQQAIQKHLELQKTQIQQYTLPLPFNDTNASNNNSTQVQHGVAFAIFRDIFRTGKMALLHTRVCPGRTHVASYTQLIYASCLDLLRRPPPSGNASLPANASPIEPCVCTGHLTDLVYQAYLIFCLYTLYQTVPYATEASPWPLALKDPLNPKREYRRPMKGRIRIDRFTYAYLLRLCWTAQAHTDYSNCRLDQSAVEPTRAHGENNYSLTEDPNTNHNNVHNATNYGLKMLGIDVVAILDRLWPCFECAAYAGPRSLEGLAGHADYYDNTPSSTHVPSDSTTHTSDAPYMLPLSNLLSSSVSMTAKGILVSGSIKRKVAVASTDLQAYQESLMQARRVISASINTNTTARTKQSNKWRRLQELLEPLGHLERWGTSASQYFQVEKDDTNARIHRVGTRRVTWGLSTTTEEESSCALTPTEALPEAEEGVLPFKGSIHNGGMAPSFSLHVPPTLPLHLQHILRDMVQELWQRPLNVRRLLHPPVSPQPTIVVTTADVTTNHATTTTRDYNDDVSTLVDASEQSVSSAAGQVALDQLLQLGKSGSSRPNTLAKKPIRQARSHAPSRDSFGVLDSHDASMRATGGDETSLAGDTASSSKVGQNALSTLLQLSKITNKKGTKVVPLDGDSNDDNNNNKKVRSRQRAAAKVNIKWAGRVDDGSSCLDGSSDAGQTALASLLKQGKPTQDVTLTDQAIATSSDNKRDRLNDADDATATASVVSTASNMGGRALEALLALGSRATKTIRPAAKAHQGRDASLTAILDDVSLATGKSVSSSVGGQALKTLLAMGSVLPNSHGATITKTAPASSKPYMSYGIDFFNDDLSEEEEDNSDKGDNDLLQENDLSDLSEDGVVSVAMSAVGMTALEDLLQQASKKKRRSVTRVASNKKTRSTNKSRQTSKLPAASKKQTLKEVVPMDIELPLDESDESSWESEMEEKAGQVALAGLLSLVKTPKK